MEEKQIGYKMKIETFILSGVTLAQVGPLEIKNLYWLLTEIRTFLKFINLSIPGITTYP